VRRREAVEQASPGNTLAVTATDLSPGASSALPAPTAGRAKGPTHAYTELMQQVRGARKFDCLTAQVLGGAEHLSCRRPAMSAAHDGSMRRLAGDAATNYRSTDHSGEIAWLRLQAVQARDQREQLAYLVAAELLQSHDETGSSLDQWVPYRALVELLLGHEILENGV